MLSGTVRAAEAPSAPIPSWTLPDLVRQSVSDLHAIYGAGVVPASLTVLDGVPHGRLVVLGGPLGRGPSRIVRRIARSRAFPWRGKAFRADDDHHGTGQNRVFGLRVFPFATDVAPSATDGAPCILLDYDVPGNPWPFNRIRDELRQVGPSTFVGPAWIRAGGEPTLFCFFAVEVGA